MGKNDGHEASNRDHFESQRRPRLMRNIMSFLVDAKLIANIVSLR
jgi:hypothetical protein